MMNQEVGRVEERISYLKKQINRLKNIPLKKVDTIQNGSLVLTNHGLFFFGIAFGKLNLEAQDLMGLSLNSPLGKLMTDRKDGDELTCMDRNYLIHGLKIIVLPNYFANFQIAFLDVVSHFRLFILNTLQSNWISHEGGSAKPNQLLSREV
jgi:hypothetical protein